MELYIFQTLLGLGLFQSNLRNCNSKQKTLCCIQLAPALCTLNIKTYGYVQMYGNHLWLKMEKDGLTMTVYLNKYMILCSNNLAINVQLHLQVHWRVAVYEQSKEFIFISIIPNKQFNLAYALRIITAFLFQSEAL